jgi:hypothetical protein
MLEHWKKPLSRPLGLRDGQTLVTLHDAATYVISAGSGALKDPVLSATSDALMAAAKTGEAADIQAATDQVGVFLADRRK